MQTCAPEYIVWNTGSGSWTRGYEKLQFVIQLRQWVDQHYDIVGLAESRVDKPGIIVWDDAVRTHVSQSDFKIIVYRKKANPALPVQE
jgi:hypothetical protein